MIRSALFLKFFCFTKVYSTIVLFLGLFYKGLLHWSPLLHLLPSIDNYQFPVYANVLLKKGFLKIDVSSVHVCVYMCMKGPTEVRKDCWIPGS